MTRNPTTITKLYVNVRWFMIQTRCQLILNILHMCTCVIEPERCRDRKYINIFIHTYVYMHKHMQYKYIHTNLFLFSLNLSTLAYH